MKEETPLPAKEVSIDSRHCSSSVSPGGKAVMRDTFIVMMQINDHGDPVRNEQAGNTVEKEDVPVAPSTGGSRKAICHEGEANVRQNDPKPMTGRVKYGKSC